jgi:hypothetical protein
MGALDWSLPHNRHYDRDGRMHCAQARITRSGVGLYRGDEIANWQGLGLQPCRIYRMYRPLDELRNMVKSVNTVPLLDRHVLGECPEAIVGALGSDAKIVGDSLHCSLSVWAKRGIDGIEHGNRSALSAAYNYCADMTPGVTADGKIYDGIMRELGPMLHVALVSTPRTADCALDAAR